VVVAYRTQSLDLGWVPADADVVVVHNDASLDPASVTHPGALHVHTGENIGFGAAVNRALPLVHSTRVVLANPDAELQPTHWDALLDGDADEVVAVPLVDAAGVLTSVVNRYPTLLAAVLMGFRVGRWFPRGGTARRLGTALLGRGGRAHAQSLTSPAGTWSLQDHWFSAGVCSLDTARLRGVGGFDFGYFLYFEDVDLSARLALVYPDMRVRVPDVTPAVHAVGGSATAETEAHRLRSARTYARRQPGPAWRVVERALALRQRGG
jgi:N-acetylglucosaminyl-diphospho-decaprenol L-rhamnosyltransferase